MRLDKWLWAARFFKTRSLAAQAVRAGRVAVNGARAKPARAVAAGDVLAIRQDGIEWVITVLALSRSRGSAAAARALYAESPQAREERETRAAKLRAEALSRDRGRPGKRARRELIRFKQERAD